MSLPPVFWFTRSTNAGGKLCSWPKRIPIFFISYFLSLCRLAAAICVCFALAPLIHCQTSITRRRYVLGRSRVATASFNWLTGGIFVFSFGGNKRYSATPIGLFTSRKVYSTIVRFFPRQV